MRRVALTPVLVAALTGVGGCLVQVDDPSTIVCVNAGDCPSGYQCVPGADAGNRCQVIYPPPVDGGGLSGVAYYCTDAKPVLDQYCATCHGIPPNSGAPATFRLDTYGTTQGIPGAVSQADRIKYRTYTVQNMPPVGSLQPTTAQRRVLAVWASSGALACDTPADAGRRDGGDGG